MNGKRVKSQKGETEWIFQSKCPGKWLHIDCEEGMLYGVSPDGGYVEPNKDLLKSGLIAISQSLLIL
ncbi:MAG: hypothetical protein HQK96_01605 [Nitrospirae bacterium]|nr:hypothetical protein [Nitrospirota bacterium]